MVKLYNTACRRAVKEINAILATRKLEKKTRKRK
jgi:hypothetical protein